MKMRVEIFFDDKFLCRARTLFLRLCRERWEKLQLWQFKFLWKSIPRVYPKNKSCFSLHHRLILFFSCSCCHIIALHSPHSTQFYRPEDCTKQRSKINNKRRRRRKKRNCCPWAFLTSKSSRWWWRWLLLLLGWKTRKDFAYETSEMMS